jgi:predicted nucleic acid-binding protein
MPHIPFVGSPHASSAGQPHEDALIAATAILHKLTVVTRNIRDFDQFGARALNRFLTLRR